MIEYIGKFENIYPHGYGGLRLIVLQPEMGKNHVFCVRWKELTAQRNEKNITIGDKIKIEYEDEYNFKLEKVEH